LRRLNPLIQIYSPDQLIIVSHLLYGSALASYPRFARQLSRPPDLPPPLRNEATPSPDVAQSDEEVGRSIL
jgi:hypothetical protein